jgi:TonB family protein
MNSHASILLFISAIFTSILAPVYLAQTAQQDSGAKVISSQPFRMPDDAMAAGIDGKIQVAFTVDKTGEVKNILIMAGPVWPCGTKPRKEIDEVLDGVKQNILTAKFSPAVKDGKPVSSDVMITFSIGDAYDAEVKRREAEKNGTPKLIRGGVINGRAINLPKPDYPPAAHSNRVGGVVTVDVLIDEQGNVARAGAASGHPLLQDDARNAACRAKFSPTTLQGNLVKVSGTITYNFVP